MMTPVKMDEGRCCAQKFHELSERGTFNLLDEKPDPEHLKVLYRRGAETGRASTCHDRHKSIYDNSHAGILASVTMLHRRILRGHLEPSGDAKAQVVASDYTYS
jgi:hypothetical protein